MMPTSVSISASSVWRVLGVGAGLLSKWAEKQSKKRTGFENPGECIGTSTFPTLTLAAPSMDLHQRLPTLALDLLQTLHYARGLQLVCMDRRSAKWREMGFWGFF